MLKDKIQEMIKAVKESTYKIYKFGRVMEHENYIIDCEYINNTIDDILNLLEQQPEPKVKEIQEEVEILFNELAEQDVSIETQGRKKYIVSRLKQLEQFEQMDDTQEIVEDVVRIVYQMNNSSTESVVDIIMKRLADRQQRQLKKPEPKLKEDCKWTLRNPPTQEEVDAILNSKNSRRRYDNISRKNI